MDGSDMFFSIKQAAEFSGLSEDTIRYYEKIGLLPYAERKPNGHRIYCKNQLEGMVFLTRLKATGMTLDEMKRYRKPSEHASATAQQKVSILKEHRKRITAEIDRLLETQRIIDYKIEHYNEIVTNPQIHNTSCDPAKK